MVHAELTIINEQGIHLGPANKIANLADRYDCQIHFKTEYMDVNAKSIINLIPYRISGFLLFGYLSLMSFFIIF